MINMVFNFFHRCAVLKSQGGDSIALKCAGGDDGGDVIVLGGVGGDD